jgi:hypothetical protein
VNAKLGFIRNDGIARDSARTNKFLARRWADRIVRIYAASALQIAGFGTQAAALGALPEIIDDESTQEARRRVDVALENVLCAREIPSAEQALVAAFAARAALAVAAQESPSDRQLKDIVGALHTGASVA